MKRLCLLADYPAWLLPGMDAMPANRGHCTWLHMLRPHFESLTHEFDIHWVVMAKGIARPVTLRTDGQCFHMLPRKRKLIAMATAYLFEIRRIKALVREIRPDLVHAWGTEDVYALAAASITGVPVLFSLQGCITQCLAVTKGKALMRLQGAYERHALKRLQNVTGESERACRNMQDINPRLHTTIVDYGIGEPFHQIVRTPATEPVITFIGSLYPAKGIPELVEVMKLPLLSGIRLEVWGTGPVMEELKASASANVSFRGHASRQQVLDALATTWALVIPTHCDTGPTVVKEARAAAVPVITTTAAGASRHVADGLSGHVIAPGDKDALTQAILSVCASRERSIEMGNHDIAICRANLLGGTTIRHFSDIYRQILAR
ncbi:MAG: glycosyltransferase [Verrucomicrobiae bacterium]|nr:glycosyltransferase [Verrucomicrobiae bacterium]